MDSHVERIAYGSGELEISIPRRSYLGTLAPCYSPGLSDTHAAVTRALEHPIGTPRLLELARGRGSAVIVVNDVTRPTRTCQLLPAVLDELRTAGVDARQVVILVATGTHRDVTPPELEALLGKDIVRDFEVVNHHCDDKGALVYVGETSHGVPVTMNRLYVEAELKILTGTISPHQTAGFTGGRKSVLPGIAGIDTLKTHHGVGLRSLRPAMGELVGNKFHESALEAARMVGVDFVVNTVQNEKKEVTHVVAGDVERAWLEGVRTCRGIFEARAPRQAEIVITSPGGYPRDIDLSQAQKSMAAAEIAVAEGGTVILPAECPDGVGPGAFYEWMAAASSPQEVIDRFFREGYSIGTSKAYLYSRCLTRADLILVSRCIPDDVLGEMFTKRADTVEEGLRMALEKQGSDAGVLVLKNGAELIPRVGTPDTDGPGSGVRDLKK